MLVIINALKSISRSKGRNILIAIIVLTIAVSSCVALAIKKAANDAKESGLDSTNITASIGLDRQKMMESAQGSTSSGSQPDMSSLRDLLAQYKDLSLEEQLAYAKSDLVKNYYYTRSTALDGTGELSPYSTEEEKSTGSTGGTFGSAESAGPGSDKNGASNKITFGGITMGDFNLTGYSAEEAMTKFVSGTSKVTSGQMFDVNSSAFECLISSELAAFNNLSVGDTITLSNPNNTVETYTFTIVGIYTESSTTNSEGTMHFSTAQDSANLICISGGAMQTLLDGSAASAVVSKDTDGNETSTALTGQLSGTYVFANKANYDAFAEELKAKGLSDYYTLSSSDVSQYEASLIPLENLSNFATTLLWIILGVGAVVLVVINVFNIRERKYEVGVLTAIGIKKSKVALQFVTELLCVTLLAILVGVGIGAVVSVPITNNLLASQVEQQQAQNSAQNTNFGRPSTGGTQSTGQTTIGGKTQNNVAVSYLTQVNATIDFTIVLQLIGIGMVLTIISSLAAVVFVLRYEPLKILANRS